MEERLQNTNIIQSRPSVHVSRPSNYNSRPAAELSPEANALLTQLSQSHTAATATVPAAPVPQAIPAPASQPLVSHHNQPIITNSLDEPAKRPLRKHLTAVFSVLAVIAFATSGVMLLGGSRADIKKADQLLSLANSAELKSSPSEAILTADNYASYRTAPELARYMTISKLGIKARVTELGAKSNNTLMPPGSIYDAAWFNGSAKPGQTGATVIEGYNQGPTKPGVFAKLNKLKPGDRIQLETGSGVKIKYKVVKTKSYDAKSVDMAAVLKPVSGSKGLNLVTCSGSTNNKNQRLVVFTTQV